MAGEYTVSGLAVPETIELLHDLLTAARTDHPDLSDTDASMIETAVVEIAGNMVQHGPPDQTLVYTFSLEVLDDRLVGVLTHSGPDLSGLSLDHAPDDPLAESGRGLALAAAVVDELRHDAVDGQNRWTMVRRREQ